MIIRPRRLVSALLPFAFAWLADAQAELQVNTYTASSQEGGSLAIDGTGNFVVVWESYAQDGSKEGIFGQRFDASGLPLGAEFQANTYTTGNQFGPDVAADASGNFLVTWSGYDGDGSGILTQRYDSTGTPVAGELQVNSYTTNTQIGASIAADANGNVVVAWQSNEQDGDGAGVFARRFDTAGVPFGPEFQVNVVTTGGQYPAGVAASPAGDFVITWSTQRGGGDYVLGRRYDGAGLPQGGEFQINTNTTRTPIVGGSVAMDAAGQFVVVWTVQRTLFGDYADIVARRFDASGTPIGGEFQVNTYTTGAQLGPTVAMDATGDFLIVWHGFDSLGPTEVAGQLYDAAGGRRGGEFQVNTYTTHGQVAADAGFDGLGNFVVTWTSSTQDGHANGIFAQRNKPEWRVRGKSFRARDPSGTGRRRTIRVLGTETATEIGPILDGNPTVDGATLRVITNGVTPSDQTFVLDAGGWQTNGPASFTYRGPTGADGDPVGRLSLKRSPTGRTHLKASLAGTIGTQSLDVVPPNPGDDGGIVLQFSNGGGTYCVAFGGTAGGIETQDDAKRWRIVNAVADGDCPTP